MAPVSGRGLTRYASMGTGPARLAPCGSFELTGVRGVITLSGIVRDGRGEPFAGATIFALATDEKTAKQVEGAIRP